MAVCLVAVDRGIDLLYAVPAPESCGFLICNSVMEVAAKPGQPSSLFFIIYYFSLKVLAPDPISQTLWTERNPEYSVSVAECL